MITTTQELPAKALQQGAVKDGVAKNRVPLPSPSPQPPPRIGEGAGVCPPSKYRTAVISKVEENDGMATERKDPREFVEREDSIRGRIVQRTAGRIQRLEVEVIDDMVVIRGCVPSYYLKQLALHGVLDAIGSMSETRIELNIEVCGPSELKSEAPDRVTWLEW
jgi:hypothetical protein